MAAPAGPPPLTKAQIARIRRTPIHRRIKHCVYGALALAVIGAVANVTCLVLGAVWARHIVDAQRWFILHYTVAAVLSIMWMSYSLVFERHIKFMSYPDQLQIDLGWIGFSVVFISCWDFYLYYKMQQYGVLDMFIVACSSGCTFKLNFVKLSPLVLGITTPILGALQLLLGVNLYRNPIINPPLDKHGMPIPQDPETGLPMPLDAKGQPILPEWLLPRDPKTGELLPCDHSGNLLDPKKAKAVREKKGKGEEAAPWGTDTEGKGEDSSAGEDDSDEDKSLLENKGMQELGRRGRRGGAGRERSSRSRRERR